MRFPVSGFILGTCALGLVASSAFSQAVISAHSGVVQYVEGRAYLNGQVVDPKFGQFPDIKDNQEFRTEQGRAEILLTPGVFLRLGENSSVKMISNRLTDTRLEMLTGSAMVECSDLPKDNSIQLLYKGNSIRLEKQGLYRIDTEPARVRVYEGEAVVTDSAGNVTVRPGKATNMDGVLQAESFDRKDTDSLYNWSDRRAAYITKANVVSAGTMANSGYGGMGLGGYDALNAGGFGLGAFDMGGLGMGAFGMGYPGFGYGYGYNPMFLGGWMFNPLFGMYTYMPYSGFGYSPFGYTFFSPYTVGYAPYYGYGMGGGGYNNTAARRVTGITGASRMSGFPAHGSVLARNSFGGARGAFTGGARSGFGAGRSGFGGARGGFGGRGVGGFSGGHAGGMGGHASSGGGHR